MRCSLAIVAAEWTLGSIGIAAGAMGQAVPASQATTRPADPHGLALQVKPDRNVIAAGEALHVMVTVQNRGREVARLLYVDHQLVQGISILASDGTPAPKTNTGRLRLENMHIGRLRNRDLPPGTQSSSNPLVSSYFDLSEPGTYTIQAGVGIFLTDSRQECLLTGETTVEVTPPPMAPYTPPERSHRSRSNGEDENGDGTAVAILGH